MLPGAHILIQQLVKLEFVELINADSLFLSYISPIHQITARAVRVTSVSMVTP